MTSATMRTAEPRVAATVLTALVLGRAAWYAVQGVDFVLDDWSFAGYRAANGVMTDVFLRSRPGTWAVQTVLFGIAGDHPLVLFGLVTALFLGVTLLLQSWLRAGDDAVAVVAYVRNDAEGDPAASHFVVGPARIYRNAITGIQDGDGK